MASGIYEFLQQFEGFEQKPYLDTKGLVTVGVGTKIEGSDVVKNQNLYLITLGIAKLKDLNKPSGEIESKILYNADGTVNQTATDALENGRYNGQSYIKAIQTAITANYTGTKEQKNTALQTAIKNVLNKTLQIYQNYK